jgi:hypothetical protein
LEKWGVGVLQKATVTKSYGFAVHFVRKEMEGNFQTKKKKPRRAQAFTTQLSSSRLPCSLESVYLSYRKNAT